MEDEKKRACAYARVSTASTEQAQSFLNQSRYWNKRLGSDPDIRYIGLFADDGISGKSMRRRPQLQALLKACRNDEVDIIYTKSVQRFARNTTELLDIVHELRDKGIAIYFEKENINTLDSSSDLYLTVAAAVAEDDLTRYSQNMIWTYQKKFQAGEIGIAFTMYGYNCKNGVVTINEEQAVIVREIFERYATGEWSTMRLSKDLNERGIGSKEGCLWRSFKILTMLRNEKYCGDALWQKYYTEHNELKRNKGQMPQYYVENSHPGIISRELFLKVQDVLETRSNKKLLGRTINRYPFTGMVRCGNCGTKYIHKVNNSCTPYACEMWRCETMLRKGKAMCESNSIKDSVLKGKFIEAFNEFIKQRYSDNDIAPYQAKLQRLCDEEKELLQLKVKGLITKEMCESEGKTILAEINQCEETIERLRRNVIKRGDYTEMTTFDEDRMKRFLTGIVIKDWIVTFEFFNGVTISKKYDNGPSGNTKGWSERRRQKNNG